MNRILLSCGGTGGHLAPGIALAEGLREKGHECRLVITRKKVDQRLVAKYSQFEFIKAPGDPFGWHPSSAIRFLASQARGLVFFLKLLRNPRPDLVMGMGGFASVAICAAAALRRVPFALHESNRIPGRAVRLLRYFGPERVYLPPGVKVKRLGLRRIRHCGCPVRREIQRRSVAGSRLALGMDETSKLLLVLGGSQGASVLNEWAEQNFPIFAHEGVNLCCVTGLGKGEDRAWELPSRHGNTARARFLPFSDDMAGLLSAADLVVARSGAGTIAELTRCRVPAILIPYPYSADDHQVANAAFFEQQGGGLAVSQDRLGDLQGEVLETLFNDWLLRRFRENLDRMDSQNDLDLILKDIEAICQETRTRMKERELEGVQC